MNIYLARQPVYDRDLNVIAYELLYRQGDTNSAGVIDNPDQASSQVLINAFVEMGVDKIVGGLPALVNVTRSFLECNPLPSNLSDKIILEILETEAIDESFVGIVNTLVSRGYKIALDDFVFDRDWALLVPRADIIKYDVMELGKEGVAKQLEMLNVFDGGRNGLKAALLAEKVETYEEFEHYKALGFDYFQGYFMAKPRLIKERGTPASKRVVLTLLGELNNPKVEVDKLEKHIAQDARLTYKLLKVINSAAFGSSVHIDNIQKAIVMLGLDELRRWASLLALSLDDGKPHELLLSAMIRARMCQILAEQLDVDDTSVYFTAGLFSLIDALMDLPLTDIMEGMPFSQELKDAVLKRGGGLIGKVLHSVIAYEAGQWDDIDLLKVGPDEIWEAYLAALEWGQVASHGMTGG